MSSGRIARVRCRAWSSSGSSSFAMSGGQSVGLTGVDGRLQAAHLSGPRSDPDAALSGSYLKAPGFAGGYLLMVSITRHDRCISHSRRLDAPPKSSESGHKETKIEENPRF